MPLLWDCNKLGLGCSCFQLPQLCWEYSPCPRYHITAKLASSSIVLQQGASAPSSLPSSPREVCQWENKGYAWLMESLEQPRFGVQPASSCFSQRLWVPVGMVQRTCAEQLLLKEMGFPLAGPSPPFVSHWPPSALLGRGSRISISFWILACFSFVIRAFSHLQICVSSCATHSGLFLPRGLAGGVCGDL